jgi:hypothetical protein
MALSGIAGSVAKDGSQLSGAGFTSERVGEPGGYSYRVVFDGAAFASPPSVLVTPTGTGVLVSVQPAADSFTVTFERFSFATLGEVTTVPVASGFAFAALQTAG